MLLIYIMVSFKKLMSDYGLGVIIILLLVAFAVSTLSDYINNKALGGEEAHTNLAESAAIYSDNAAHASIPDSQPSSDFAPASGPAGPAAAPISNPQDLLPADSNNDFSDMAPSSNGGNNASLLSAGHHMGAAGSDAPLRNANLQLRGEEANPRSYSGPWNNSTIEADTVRKGIGA
jgi:hypothetical protein